MIAGKNVDLGQLQTQTAALGGTHVGHSLTGYGNNPNIDLRCDTGSGIVDLCATGQTALASHTPVTDVTLTPGASNGGSAPTPTLIAGSNATRGAVNIGSGTAPTAGEQVVVTFPNPLSNPPVITMTPMNAATAAAGLYVTSTTTSLHVFTRVAPAASQPVGTYQFMYIMTA